MRSYSIFGDMPRYRKHEKAGDTVPKTLNKKMMYIGGKERHYKISKASCKEVSNGSSKFLNMVMKALNSDPMKAVTDFQRISRQMDSGHHYQCMCKPLENFVSAMRQTFLATSSPAD